MVPGACSLGHHVVCRQCLCPCGLPVKAAAAVPHLGRSCSPIHWVRLSAYSLEVTGTVVSCASISLQDGRYFTPKASLKVLAVEGATKGPPRLTSRREKAAIRACFHHRKCLTCRRVPPPLVRLRDLCASAGAAFLYGAVGGSVRRTSRDSIQR